MKSPPTADDLTGHLIGERYRILQPLGVGGFGVVYIAEHVVTRRKFAVKVLQAELGQRAKIADRFIREATTTAKIDHENIVEIVDVGRTEGGALYFSMELLKGETLADLLAREGRIPYLRAVALILQVCRGLQAAHAHGIVHRDLKPANIFRITRAGNQDFVKILDFGIAKLIERDGGESSPALTSRHEVLGTPLYMSPEQAAGDTVDVRTDVYSTGVMLFEMLAGKRPFAGKSQADILRAVIAGKSTPLATAAPDLVVPDPLVAVISRAMANEQADRFPDMTAMIAALEEAVTGVARPLQPAPASAPSLVREATDFTPSMHETQPAIRAARESRRTLGLAVLAVCSLGVLAWIAAALRASPPPAEPAPAPTVVAAPAPAPEPTPPPPEPPPEQPPAPTTKPVKSTKSGKRRPACDDALAAALARATPAKARACARGTGVTVGDRVRLSLSGDASTATLTVKILESSGSKQFDACLTQTISAKKFPTDTSPAQCVEIKEFRVP